jgi:hypothetical protein
VDCDAVRTSQFHKRSGSDWIGLDGPAGLPDRGDVINVDVQKNHLIELAV